jgi:uncharacterized protein YjiS (DUF1127 family)
MSLDMIYETEVLGRSVSVSSRRTDTAELVRQARQDRAEIVGSAIGDLLGKGLKKVAYSLEAWRQRRATYSELNALDDRLLADLGIQRADIPAIAEGTAHRPIMGGRMNAGGNLRRAA